tara:strand:+ start:85 stop:891 length:807 start_codon:yes stop_codon:yes gene_type:complete
MSTLQQQLDEFNKQNSEFIEILHDSQIDLYYKKSLDEKVNDFRIEQIELTAKRENFAITHISSIKSSMLENLTNLVYKKDVELDMQIEKTDQLDSVINRANEISFAEIERFINSQYQQKDAVNFNDDFLKNYSNVAKNAQCIVRLKNSKNDYVTRLLTHLIVNESVLMRDYENLDQQQSNQQKRNLKHTIMYLSKRSLLDRSFYNQAKAENIKLNSDSLIKLSKFSLINEFIAHVVQVINDNMSTFAQSSKLKLNVEIEAIELRVSDK